MESERADGSPSFLSSSEYVLFTVNAFDAPLYGTHVSIDYKIGNLPNIAVNLADLAAGLSAFTGVTVPAAAAPAPPSAPSVIFNGSDAPLTPSQATVLVGYYKVQDPKLSAASSTEAHPAPSLPPDVPHSEIKTALPYGINVAFFLQFQPNAVTLAQGQELTNNAAPVPPTTGVKCPGQSSQITPYPTGNNDSSLYLNKKLAQLGTGSSVIAIGPIPNSLKFSSDNQPLGGSCPGEVTTEQNEAINLVAASTALIRVQMMESLTEVIADQYTDNDIDRRSIKSSEAQLGQSDSLKAMLSLLSS